MPNTRQRRLPLMLLTLGIAVSLAAQPVSAAEGSSLAERVEAEVFVQAQAIYPDAEIGVDVSSLDPRITLAPCPELSIEPRGQRRLGRVPVAVSCAQPAWNVFLSATVSVMQPVVVTRHALPRGTQLSTAQLITEMRDLTEVRQSHYTSPAAILGMELKRPLPPGSVVYASMLKVPIAIKRGDKVVIVASRGSVNISVPGESLERGMPGEQIRVRNRQSEKTVHAWVVRPGVVSTTPVPSSEAQARQIADLH